MPTQHDIVYTFVHFCATRRIIELNRTPDEFRRQLEANGISIAEWARTNKFSCGLVYQILEGKRRCLRGQSHRIAVALGIKPPLTTESGCAPQIMADQPQEENAM